MRFYTKQHKFYCDIDLHARTMYICIIDHEGTILTHRNMPATAEALADVIQPYREDLVLAVECIFTWYWVADLCNRIGVEFVLGHALYMKAIHSGKVKNDKIDSQKIVSLPPSGILPMAYVYPQPMRSTRDLLRTVCEVYSRISWQTQNRKKLKDRKCPPEAGLQRGCLPVPSPQ